MRFHSEPSFSNPPWRSAEDALVLKMLSALKKLSNTSTFLNGRLEVSSEQVLFPG